MKSYLNLTSRQEIKNQMQEFYMMQQSNGCGPNSPSSFQNPHHQVHQHHAPSPPQMPSVTTISRTWHPHVYAKPPRHPTPHFIADILGFRDRVSTPEMSGNSYCPITASELVQEPMPLLNGTPISKPALIHHSEIKAPVDQPLNLSCPESKKSSSNSPYVPTSISSSPISGDFEGQGVTNGTMGPQDTIVIPSVVCKLRLELSQKAGTPPNGTPPVTGNLCINRPIAKTEENILTSPCHKDGTVPNVMTNPLNLTDAAQPMVKGKYLINFLHKGAKYTIKSDSAELNFKIL